MNLLTPQIDETAPGTDEFVLAHGTWVVVQELPPDARCRGCHNDAASINDERPWAEVPQGRRQPALFCPECIDEFKHG